MVARAEEQSYQNSRDGSSSKKNSSPLLRTVSPKKKKGSHGPKRVGLIIIREARLAHFSRLGLEQNLPEIEKKERKVLNCMRLFGGSTRDRGRSRLCDFSIVYIK